MSEGRTMNQLRTAAPRVKPELSDTEYNGLESELAKVRSTSETVKVNKAALQKLLSDHAQLTAFYDHFA